VGVLVGSARRAAAEGRKYNETIVALDPSAV
jgi:hypothetical protein